MCGSDFFLAILAIFFPPISVWVKVGICTADSIINLALCCLGYIPGLIHAWYIILKYPEPDYDDPVYAPIPSDANPGDLEGNRVTYYYVSHRPMQNPNPQQRNYGTVGSQPPQEQQTGNGDGGPGSSGQTQDGRPPPTYAEAVRGDNKIQTNE